MPKYLWQKLFFSAASAVLFLDVFCGYNIYIYSPESRLEEAMQPPAKQLQDKILLGLAAVCFIGCSIQTIANLEDSHDEPEKN